MITPVKLLGLNSICLKIYDYPFEHIYKSWFRGTAFISYPFHCKYNMKYFKSTYYFYKRNLPMTPWCFHNFKHEAIIGLRENLFGLLGLAQNYFPIQMCNPLCKKKSNRTEMTTNISMSNNQNNTQLWVKKSLIYISEHQCGFFHGQTCFRCYVDLQRNDIRARLGLKSGGCWFKPEINV